MVLKVARPKTASVLIVLGLVLALTAGMSALFAPVARATSGMISASAGCSEGCDCVPIISWTAYAVNESGPLAASQDDAVRIDLQVQLKSGPPWTTAFFEIGRGEFNAGNGYSFSGTYDASAWAGYQVRVRAYSEQNWVGHSYGANTAQLTGWINVPEECPCEPCEVTTTTAVVTTTTVAGPSTTVTTLPGETTTTVGGPSTTQGGPTTTEPELPYTGGNSPTPAAPIGIAAVVLLLAGFGLLAKARAAESR